MHDRWLSVLVAVGVVALLVGGAIGVAALRSDEPPSEPAAATQLATRHVVSKKGGFAVDVPTTMRVERRGRTLRMTSRDRSLVVTAGPAGPGALRPATRRILESMRRSYSGVSVIGRRDDRIDGRRALTTYGRAASDRARLRFVVMVVAAKPHSYAVTTFTAAGSDPRRVLPAVNRISGSFRVLTKGR